MPSRDADGRLRIAVTVRNAGPLRADLPTLDASKLPPGRWESGCQPLTGNTFWLSTPNCRLAPLAVGESRTLTYLSDALTAAGASVTVASEGPDLSAADNTAPVAIVAPSTFGLDVPASARWRDGVKVDVRSVLAGRARVTVAFKVRGRTVKFARIVKLKAFTARTVTVRPKGVAARIARRVAPVKAHVTVRRFNGKDPLTMKTTLR